MLTPPQGFGCVEDGIYRCSTLDQINLHFLSTLELSTIVSLNPARPHKATRTFAADNGIDLVHLAIQPWRNVSDWNTISKELTQDTLSYILDKRNYPLLLIDGANVFVGFLRQWQHWTFSSILMEYRAFAGDYKASYKTEVVLEFTQFKCISHEEAVRRRKSIEQGIRPTLSLTASGRLKVDPKKRGIITLNLPPEDVLPEWFKRGERLWAEEQQARAEAGSKEVNGTTHENGVAV